MELELEVGPGTCAKILVVVCGVQGAAVRWPSYKGIYVKGHNNPLAWDRITRWYYTHTRASVIRSQLHATIANAI